MQIELLVFDCNTCNYVTILETLSQFANKFFTVNRIISVRYENFKPFNCVQTNQIEIILLSLFLPCQVGAVEYANCNFIKE